MARLPDDIDLGSFRRRPPIQFLKPISLSVGDISGPTEVVVGPVPHEEMASVVVHRHHIDDCPICATRVSK